MLLTTTDTEIRSALHGKKLRQFRAAPDTIIVDELGLAHARVRIDVAVINSCVHGYEIKSSLDTLDRLPAQFDVYSTSLGKLTIVCAPRHTARVMKIAPAWTGVLEAEKGARGAVGFISVRRARLNPGVDAEHLAHLLWRPEVMALLARHGFPPKILRQSRKQLYRHLAELMTVGELTEAIRGFMQARRAWRGPPAPA
jgi:hypothetical protein